MVKNPGTEALLSKISHKQARADEANFFKEKPWSRAPLAVQKSLGTPILVQRLGVLLESLIKSQLPGLLQTIKSALTAVVKDLNALPTHVEGGEAVGFVARKCKELSLAVDKAAVSSACNGSSELSRSIRQDALNPFHEAVT